MLQVHRGLSSGVLGGIHDLDNARAEKARTVEQAFNAIDTLVASGEQNLETWKKIKFDWKRIRDSGMDWSRAENFAGHTRLIDEMLQHEAVIADEFGLTSDPDLDTFYLIYTSNNEILRSLEHLGQIRAIGTGILGAKELSEQQAADMKTLLSLLSYTLKPLKLSLDKAMRYNPEMRQDLVTIYDNIDGSSRRIIDAVHADILDRRFSMQPAEFFCHCNHRHRSGLRPTLQVATANGRAPDRSPRTPRRGHPDAHRRHRVATHAFGGLLYGCHLLWHPEQH